jgi:thymidylate kinase
MTHLVGRACWFPTPLAPRGLSVAIIGPDGAGKSTLVHALHSAAVVPAEIVYMGYNPGSTTHCLPTTRWMQRRGARARGGCPLANPGLPRSASRTRLLLRALRELLGLAHQLLEYAYRFSVAYAARCRGTMVLFDRYVYDLLIDALVDGTSPWHRVRARLCAQIFPRPDIVLILDAPGSLLFARKGEHTPERLERLRHAYQQIAQTLPCVVYLDARQAPTDVLWAAMATIQQHREDR